MAFLILADGTYFAGQAVGTRGSIQGEMIFNTSQTGYQEILTDPSYHGQIINFTTPHIGNVGVTKRDNESKKIHAAGAIFKDFSLNFSNCFAEDSLHNFLLKEKLIALSDLDTRALTLHLREKGSQIGCLVNDESLSPEQALVLAKNYEPKVNLAALVSTQEIYCYSEVQNPKAHIVVIDCGVKAGILQSLAKFPLKISVVPANINLEKLQSLSADGIVFSNGPGDPIDCDSLIALAAKLFEKKIPLFGICLGHQIMALAAGAKTKKMKFGHHGANHPIQCKKTGSVFISSQNHGYVVDESSLPAHLSISHISLFDQSIAGLAYHHAPALSFQGHPEANPGPNELMILFNAFISEVNGTKLRINSSPYVPRLVRGT